MYTCQRYVARGLRPQQLLELCRYPSVCWQQARLLDLLCALIDRLATLVPAPLSLCCSRGRACWLECRQAVYCGLSTSLARRSTVLALHHARRGQQRRTDPHIAAARQGRASEQRETTSGAINSIASEGGSGTTERSVDDVCLIMCATTESVGSVGVTGRVVIPCLSR